MAVKTIVGLIERVKVVGGLEKVVTAKIDTGADYSSIDITLASELRLGPITETLVVRSTHGRSHRPVIKAKLKIKKRIINARFTLMDRRRMKYKLLIGLNILKKDFLVDPSKGKK